MTNLLFPFKPGRYYKYIGHSCDQWEYGDYFEYAGNNQFFGNDKLVYQLEDERGMVDPIQYAFDINSEIEKGHELHP